MGAGPKVTSSNARGLVARSGKDGLPTVQTGDGIQRKAGSRQQTGIFMTSTMRFCCTLLSACLLSARRPLCLSAVCCLLAACVPVSVCCLPVCLLVCLRVCCLPVCLPVCLRVCLFCPLKTHRLVVRGGSAACTGTCSICVTARAVANESCHNTPKYHSTSQNFPVN
jgi:hypothetical protein